MPLPNPAYLSDEYFNWDGDTEKAVLLATDAAVTGVKRTIRWAACDVYDRERIHQILSGYNDHRTTPGAESTWVSGFVASDAWQVINYGGTIVAGNNAGLEDGVEYTASAVVNGTEYPISVTGAASDTFTSLLAKINADITDASVVINGDGNLELLSDNAGAGEIVEIFDQNLFSSIAGWTLDSLEEIRVGCDDIEDAFDLNIRDESNNQPYSELLIGKLRVVPNKVPRLPRSSLDVYFNQGSLAWLLVSTDLAP